jgi:phosphatidylglycerol:prolipoprotein diacylglycerol transferase
MAIGYCAAAREHGFYAPEDFLVAGFDNAKSAESYKPRLTTVDRGTFGAGYQGCDALFRLISGEEIPQIIKDPSILWDFKNGYVVYGGIIGGILASYIYCRTKKQAFMPYFDLVMPAVSFAQGFGRFGCFFAGCCYGRETDAWYGITFHNSSFAPNGVKLIPTQLISAAGDFLICALLLWFASKRPKTGRVAAAYLVLYGIGRFAVEFLRNDYRGSVGVLSTSQLISIGAVIGGIVLYFAAPKLAGVGNVAEEKSVG